MHELYLVAHLDGVLLKLVINWWLFGCYTRRETTSVFGVFNVYCHNEFISRVISKNLRDFLKLVPIVRNSSPQLLLFPQCQRRLIADTLKTRDCHTTNTTTSRHSTARPPVRLA